jgi:hypothetical protein
MVRAALLGVAVVWVACAVPSRADVRSPDGAWVSLDVMPAAEQGREAWVRPVRYTPARADMARLKTVLGMAPKEGDGEVPLRISLPNPEGGFDSFDIVEYSMMEPGLAAAFPEVRTYLGQGVTNPAANVHLDITPAGFHAQVLAPEGAWAIDPYSRDEVTHYASYYFRDYQREVEWVCHTGPDQEPVTVPAYMSRATGQTLRTYRMAVAATASYTGWHGGTVAQGQAAIVTGINRVNQIYGNEFAVRFTLVANNQNLIYTAANPGPYTDGNLSTMLGQNQSNINSVIGSSNYDIGHVLSGLNLGGLAYLRALCSSTNKARGGTGLGSPIGDPFWVQYVSHEIGHQCGANHTFNADDSASGNVCLPNRNGTTAYEPGSGSTIMSYSHLCGPNNQLQSGADPMFNQGSYAEIAAHISGTGSCSSNTATGNTAPAVNAGPDRSIPSRTAFLLTAAASDANNDTMTYSWEQRNTGPAQPVTGAGSADNGSSPLFRVFPPVTGSARSFPRQSFVSHGTPSLGEQVPVLARTMRMRATVRDNRAGGGGVNTDDVLLTVVATAGPFRVTSPNTNVTWSGEQTVTWDVAGTNATPINCANVKISLSTNGAQSFDHVLLASTPNDGSAVVTLPDLSTNLARIRIDAVDNYFYDISDVSFTITAAPGLPAPTDVAANPGTVCPGSSTTLSATVPAGQAVDWYTGGCGTTFVGTGPSIVVSPTVNTSYRARARSLSNGQTSDACGVVFVSMGTGPVIGTQPQGAAVVEGDPVTLSVSASGTFPLSYQWRYNGGALSDNGVVTGATSPDLTLMSVEASQAGTYDVVVSNGCGSVPSAAVVLSVSARCGTADFDGDGDIGTDADIEAFFACLAGSCCPTCWSAGADFNGDGDIGTDADIESFFRVLAGGEC